jgi:uncharacterized membrane protein YdbT with pleckstrin-like domain
MKKLHPGTKWIFRLRAYSILVFLGFFFVGWGVGFISPIIGLIFGSSIVALVVFGFLFYVLFVVIVAEIYSRMAYNRFLYEVGDEGVKIEKGIIWKKYTSIPYQRVQNVDIRRGIIARMLGFSTVDIETAGGSWGYRRRGRGGYRSEGHLPGVGFDEAEDVRKFVMNKVRKYGGSGID